MKKNTHYFLRYNGPPERKGVFFPVVLCWYRSLQVFAPRLFSLPLEHGARLCVNQVQVTRRYIPFVIFSVGFHEGQAAGLQRGKGRE